VRVVDLTQWYSPVSGGIRTYLRAKAAWAESQGLDHAAVVTGPRPGAETVAASAFVRVRGLTPTPRWGYRVAPRAAPVIAALERLEPSVVVIHDALAFPHAVARWARRNGVGVAMVCHSDLALAGGGLPRIVRGPVAAALGAVQRRALAAPATVIVASAASRARLAPAVRAPLVTSALGVDLELFGAARPDAALRRRLAPPGARVLLYAGRVSSEKRIDLLPPMLAELDATHVLVIAGTGAAVPQMARAARRLGVERRLVTLGHVSDRAGLATLMATADCFVHPNPAEPFGLCPLEALAAGCRVVAPDAAGTAETLGGRGAVLVRPDDARALAQGVRRALGEPRPRPDLSSLTWGETFAREWAVYGLLARAA
jgi:alpha-1,6-mannosyltransferase